MSKTTISLLELFKTFPDAESARKYLEETMWPHGAVCPECGCLDRITTRKGGYYRCNFCKLDFTIRTGTIFGRSHNDPFLSFPWRWGLPVSGHAPESVGKVLCS
jgi:hypothetical protein